MTSTFLHGFATASYQVEGSVDVDGRGSSVWDDLCNREGAIVDGSSGSEATDTYHRYKEDVALIKELGANSHRFSLSWSRIIPLGGADDPVNPLGVQFYNNFIDELIANGIEPMVTLFHWDLPLALQKRYGGWLDKEQATRDFVNYARVCFSHFGDRVKLWITLNEPFCTSILGHSLGVHAPGRSSDRTKSPEGDSATEPWIVGHSLLVAHASAVDLYRREEGEIGISLNGDWCEPWDDSEENIAAAQRAQEFWVSWFADPIYLTGDYPSCMREQLGDRLPTFSKEEKKLVLGSSDFYGMNHYTSNLIKNKSGPAAADDYQGNVEYTTVGPNGNPPALGYQSQCGWLQTAPWGFRKLLVWIYKRYGVPIIVTENGMPVRGEGDLPIEQALNDGPRVDFFKGYLENLELAMKEDGVAVRGYIAWSLLDNFEWAEGYIPRFGVVYVDYTTQKRTPKRSAHFIKQWFEEKQEKEQQ
ncbi:glycoside hydrolase family 1 protein [Leucosporidium creatinivorum]|uniref:beta-glucosidase n=1 Tax=Leucosporidium creatinivorum TaxID=106004 RepID=A0A1Y2DCN3_9BASI|nr:glycoside hydrolase family 1 protein [Leucosporidium creatinivorum]